MRINNNRMIFIECEVCGKSYLPFAKLYETLCPFCEKEIDEMINEIDIMEEADCYMDKEEDEVLEQYRKLNADIYFD